MCRVLVVEDEFFVAYEIEQLVTEMGHEPIGIASDARSALELGKPAEVALIDLNLKDGPTGPSIGRILAEEHGVTVLFMTANPSQLGSGVPGTLGALAKPATEDELRQALDYAVSRRAEQVAVPPARMRVFSPLSGYSPVLA